MKITDLARFGLMIFFCGTSCTLSLKNADQSPDTAKPGRRLCGTYDSYGLLEAVQGFIAVPSEERGRRVLWLLPKEPPGPDACPWLEYDHSKIAEKVEYLLVPMRSGNAMAIRVNLGLLKIASGAFREELMINGNDALHAAPEVFLQELKLHSGDRCIQELMLTHPSVEQSEQEEKDRLSLQIKLLESVKALGLQRLKRDCIQVIENYMKSPDHSE